MNIGSFLGTRLGHFIDLVHILIFKRFLLMSFIILIVPLPPNLKCNTCRGHVFYLSSRSASSGGKERDATDGDGDAEQCDL